MKLGTRSFGSKRLIAEFRQGDSQAFERIYKRYRTPLMAFVKSRATTLCESSVEEIIQETFLRAFRFRESYKEEYEFSTWLWSIARNSMIDHIGSTPPETREADGSMWVESEPHPACNAEEGLIQRNELKRLLRFFRRLPSGQRRALFLRVVRQLSYEEIAERMKVSLSAVKSVMNRAKSTLVDDWREWELAGARSVLFQREP